MQQTSQLFAALFLTLELVRKIVGLENMKSPGRCLHLIFKFILSLVLAEELLLVSFFGGKDSGSNRATFLLFTLKQENVVKFSWSFQFFRFFWGKMLYKTLIFTRIA